MRNLQCSTKNKQFMCNGRAIVLAALFISVCCTADQLTEVVLSANDVPINVEIADTDETRARGLTYRKALPDNNGMLFIFRKSGLHSMWMRNTGMHLSVAFLDGHGRILNIEEMMPNTNTLHTAARPAKYALEVNHGWFAEHGVEPGMFVKGLENIPDGR